MRLLLVSWIFLGLAACGKRAAVAPGTVTTPAAPVPAGVVPPAGAPHPPVPALSTEGVRLKAFVREQPGANVYHVALEWSGLGAAEPPILLREDEWGNTRGLATLEPGAVEFVDREATAGTRYRYALARIQGSETVTVAAVTVTLPRDLVLRGERRVRKVAGFQRLFLESGAKVIGEDGILEIDVGAIHSDGAVLSNFPEKLTAPAGRPGRGGTYIRVRAQRGSGVVNVVARGESGGPGLEGAPGMNGSAGGPGLPADVRQTDISKGAGPIAFSYFEERMRNLGWHKHIPNLRVHFHCNRAPTAGMPGRNGAAGGTGGSGAPGGDAARVLVRIAQPQGLEVRTESVPGIGGTGGVGGPGGKPGPGGPPGLRDPLEICPAATWGPPGKPGPVGPRGASGANGKDSAVCLKLGPATHGNCDALSDLMASGG